MKYTCIDKGRYRFHLVETNKFKTVAMRIGFKRELEEKLITEREILAGILSNSTGNCKTLRDLILQKEDLYQLGFGYSTKTSGRYILFQGEVKFIHEKYTEEGMNEKSIRFFLDSLFHPNLENDSFQQQAFELEQRNYLEFLEGKDDNPSRYAGRRLYEIIGKGTPLAYDHSGNADILKDTTPKSLYQSYLDMLENDCIDIFLIGEMKEAEVISILDEYFTSRKEVSLTEPHFLTLNEVEEQEVIEHKEFKQSKLRMCYEIENMTDFERKYVLPIYNFILGGDSSSLLFQNIREKSSLCYDVHSSTSPIYSFFTISAGIEAKDYEKTVSLAKEQVELMTLGKFEEEEIEKVKLNYKTSFKEMLDSPFGILNIVESHEYLGYDYIEDRIRFIDTVTKDMIVSLANKVKLKAIYFLEGNDDNEENRD